jgi:hypothetical protein
MSINMPEVNDQSQGKISSVVMSLEQTHEEIALEDLIAGGPVQKRTLDEETNLIERFQQDSETAGLIGEKRNAALVLLSAVSAKLEKPLHLTVQGASSAGKNHLIGTVLKFVPEDMQKFLSGMTPKVLMHADEHEFEHKVVYIAEYEGAAKADYAIRTMQSEKVIQWDFVETGASGIKKKNNRVNGPAAFIQATTRPVLHPENETRLLFAQIDESEEQTRAILLRQGEDAEGREEPPTAELFREWRELIANLQSVPVRVPFARWLAENFPVDLVRARRDFPKLLGLIETSAFLHQRHREWSGPRIVAQGLDYEIGRALFEHCYGVGPEKRIVEMTQAAEALQENAGGFIMADLIEKLKWGKTKAYEVMKRCEELGSIAQTEQGRYKFLKPIEAGLLALPESIPEPVQLA